MADTDALAKILAQVKAAKAELDAYAPTGFGWYDRAVAAAKTLVPWLVKEAPGLRVYVEDVLNSPDLLRSTWAALKARIEAPAEVARMDELLTHESILLEARTGDTVSVVVTRHLLSRFPGAGLAGNSKSDYPDTFLVANDYSGLPARGENAGEIGAALRARTKKPARVPDGLEVKTSKNGANIDCHYPHAGLHLMLSFTTAGKRAEVDDVLAAFLSRQNYRISGRNTEATTVKASFTRAPFVSLLPTTS